MEVNPILNKLGFTNRDRVVIIHTDDIGMCHASVQAYIDLVEFGLISSAATMTPCSWFPLLAKFCRQNPNVDMGVHLTLNSEWEFYKWSPLSTREPASGLVDSEGYFYRTSEETQASGKPESVEKELNMQYEHAQSAGIDVTHLDMHMFTLAQPKFITSYIQLAIRLKLPFLFPRLDETGFQMLGLDLETASRAVGIIPALEEQGIPLVDYATGLNLTQPENRIEQAKQTLNELPIGVTHFIIHPSIDTPELRAITPDWECRLADYLTFMNEDMRNFINNIGLQVIGYKPLKELFPT